MEITGNVALVTGGGSGLGEAVALLLGAQGAKVVVLDVNAEAAQSVAERVGGIASAIDVADSDAVEALVRDVSATVGLPRILVNCAGIGAPAKIIGRDGALQLSTFEKVVRVNLLGTFNTLRVFAQEIAANGVSDDEVRTNGVVINTASIAAFDGQIGQPAYAASKAGVVGLTLPAARELARYGIRVLTIAPGLFMTPMLGLLPEEALTALSKSIPFPPRLGEAEEFARLVSHLIENDMMNGETIRIDGANRLPPR